MNRYGPTILAWVLIVASLLGLGWLKASILYPPSPAPIALPPVRLDSSAVVRAVDVQRVRDSIGLVVRDSLRHAFRSAPVREVIRWLPTGDTIHDTLPPALVPDATIRATADSLATCRQRSDSLTGAVTIATARDSLHSAALDSANRRTCPSAPTPPEPPSRALWASLGATVAALITAAITIATR